MNLIISFSGRKNGICDEVSNYIACKDDVIKYFRDLDIHNCSNCNYECFSGPCKYRQDEMYNLCESMLGYDKIFLIVPMYCGNPSSLYFIFNERSQEYFMHNEAEYENIIERLYIIGIYGDNEKFPDFIPCLEKWFNGSKYSNHVLGIERHKYDLKLKDPILKVEEIKNSINEFINSEER